MEFNIIMYMNLLHGYKDVNYKLQKGEGPNGP